MDELLTPNEIAKELRVTGETVRAWCRSGRLEATRAGWSYRIKRSDLDAFLKASKEVPKKADGLAAFAN
jgi:excisionase family DNA binding protein